MPVSGASHRRRLLAFALSAVLLFVLYASLGHHADDGAYSSPRERSATGVDNFEHVSDEVAFDGRAIAPKLGNETLKAELGRAAWKVFHTTLARFPERPTADESASLRTYIHLFQKLYPCGECAAHFGKILARYPPQVSGRNVAAGWGCHVHNKVNEDLGKPIFDCTKIGDFYDCGCADDEEDPKGGEAHDKQSEGRSNDGEGDEKR